MQDLQLSAGKFAGGHLACALSNKKCALYTPSHGATYAGGVFDELGARMSLLATGLPSTR